MWSNGAFVDSRNFVTDCCQLFSSYDEAHAIALILEASRTIETHPPALLALIYRRRRTLRPIDHDARRLANRNNTCGVKFGWHRALISDLMDATGGLMKALHQLFDQINESVEDYIDLIAERAVQLGGIANSVSTDIFTEISRGVEKWLWMVEAHLQLQR